MHAQVAASFSTPVCSAEWLEPFRAELILVLNRTTANITEVRSPGRVASKNRKPKHWRGGRGGAGSYE